MSRYGILPSEEAIQERPYSIYKGQEMGEMVICLLEKWAGLVKTMAQKVHVEFQ